MLQQFDAELTEAYGIYVDDEFIGGSDKDVIVQELQICLQTATQAVLQQQSDFKRMLNMSRVFT